MQPLDFEPIKTTAEFLRNYELHDKAVGIVKQYFSQSTLQFYAFGEDNRNKRVWEGGHDKPDFKILYWNQSAFLDIKGHKNRVFWLNKRAYDSYLEWGKRESLPVYLIWVILNEGRLFYKQLPFANYHEGYAKKNSNIIVKVRFNEVKPITFFLRDFHTERW